MHTPVGKIAHANAVPTDLTGICTFDRALPNLHPFWLGFIFNKFWSIVGSDWNLTASKLAAPGILGYIVLTAFENLCFNQDTPFPSNVVPYLKTFLANAPRKGFLDATDVTTPAISPPA